MMGHNSLFEDLTAQLKQEFQDLAQDTFVSIYQYIDSAEQDRTKREDAFMQLRREAHNIKGSAPTYGYPVIGQIAHRLESYMMSCEHQTLQDWNSLRRFIDAMASCLERPQEPKGEELSELIRNLPVVAEITDIQVKDLEIMLVCPSKTVAMLLSNEMRQCGFHVNWVSNPIDALTMAINMPPDGVISANVMDLLSGPDLVRALDAISTTQDCPKALLTSNASIKEENINGNSFELIHSGASFSEDFADFVIRHDLG